MLTKNFFASNLLINVPDIPKRIISNVPMVGTKV